MPGATGFIIYHFFSEKLSLMSTVFLMEESVWWLHPEERWAHASNLCLGFLVPIMEPRQRLHSDFSYF